MSFEDLVEYAIRMNEAMLGQLLHVKAKCGNCGAEFDAIAYENQSKVYVSAVCSRCNSGGTCKIVGAPE